jgi:uncharacterized membrane protein YdjX (TVP38/TMEM64 family)
MVLHFFPEEKVADLEARLSGRQQVLALLVLRLMPISPFDLINYAAGLTRIPFRHFMVVTLIGVLPANFALAYFGQIGLTADVYGLIVMLIVVLLVILIWPKLWQRVRH